MSEQKHTPGPWRYEPDLNTHVIRQRRDDDGFEDYIASTWGGEREADARLIASAPELLEALHQAESLIDTLALACLDRVDSVNDSRRNAIIAAIAKATGAAA